MNISHIAIWTHNLEELREFYCTYFGAKSNEIYVNRIKQFSSYFLTFEKGDCSLEIMNNPYLLNPEIQIFNNLVGLAHFSFSVGSKEEVDAITARFREAGIPIFSEPRFTGDGFYESAIKDPDGNIVEITI
jgi:catechol 2,3-dioxygenase-like lactoylglutathione lyase family enzyme